MLFLRLSFRRSESYRAAIANREPRAQPARSRSRLQAGGTMRWRLTQPAAFTFPPACCLGGQQWVLWAEVTDGQQSERATVAGGRGTAALWRGCRTTLEGTAGLPPCELSQAANWGFVVSEWQGRSLSLGGLNVLYSPWIPAKSTWRAVRGNLSSATLELQGKDVPVNNCPSTKSQNLHPEPLN